MIGRVWFPKFLWAGTTEEGYGVICVRHSPWFGIGSRRTSVFVNEVRPNGAFFDISWRDSQGGSPIGAFSYHTFQSFWGAMTSAGELRSDVVPANEEGWR